MTLSRPKTAPCGCPTHVGRAVTDSARHAAWHALVIDQGGPVGRVDAVTLPAARGAARQRTLYDEKSRKRALARIRRRALAIIDTGRR